MTWATQVSFSLRGLVSCTIPTAAILTKGDRFDVSAHNVLTSPCSPAIATGTESLFFPLQFFGLLHLATRGVAILDPGELALREDVGRMAEVPRFRRYRTSFNFW
jgi:hypothetical protein